MKKETKEKIFLTIMAGISGAILILKGFGIIDSDKPGGSSPSWIFIAMGVAFILGGITVMVGELGHFNELAASIIVAVLGSVFGWISLYANDSGVSGSLVFISGFTGIPIHRLVFGLGAILCFIVSAYALKRFCNRFV